MYVYIYIHTHTYIYFHLCIYVKADGIARIIFVASWVEMHTRGGTQNSMHAKTWKIDMHYKSANVFFLSHPVWLGTLGVYGREGFPRCSWPACHR